MASLSELDGLISDEVGEALRKRATDVDPGHAIVELGSYRGKSTCYLASGARDGVPVYAVDAWDLYGNIDGHHGFHDAEPMFDRQIDAMGFSDRVVKVKSFSVPAADKYEGPTIALLFIDGDHEQQAVLADFAAWERHLSIDACVVFDDFMSTRSRGVRLAVEDLDRAGKLVDIGVVVDWLAVGTYAC